MSQFTFPLPDVGEGLTEAEIVSWRVKPGDEVAVNQVVCEIETAKSPGGTAFSFPGSGERAPGERG